MKKIGIILFLITMFFAGCVSPGAFKAKITGMETRFDKLEKVADTFVSWKKTIQAENITYGGAGMVAIGLIVITVVFLGAFGLLIRMLLKKTTLLKLVTTAVQRTQPHIREAVKKQIGVEVSNVGNFKPTHKHQLRKFTEKVGTFAKKD